MSVDRLIQEMAFCRHDPLRFVMVGFTWGHGELADFEGPDSWQIDTLNTIGEKLKSGEINNVSEAIQIAVASGHGIGKAQSLATTVPTPTGMVRWGDLRPGDALFGPDGKPTLIQACHHYEQAPMYRVTFDDGSWTDVSSGHLWTVRGRQERRNGSDSWRTLETIELLELGVKRKNGAALARQWEIPSHASVEFEEQEIDLHPYLVGMWLGDGSKGKPRYTKPYPEPTDYLRGLGYDITDEARGSRYVRSISHLMTDPVFNLGSHDRYIPRDYLINSADNRWELFCGLMDADGEVQASGSIGYSTSSKNLADDVLFLARSLGFKVMQHPTTKVGAYGDDIETVLCRPAYRLTINAPVNPFRVARKRDAFKPSEHRYTARWIDSIEPIGDMPCMCVTVDRGDGLYLTENFIVTHNSALVSWLILWAMSTFPDTKGVVTANTETQLKTKTWAELAKWHRLCITREWFTFTATALFSTDANREKTWRIDMAPWSEHNTEAFAGLHNKGRRILLIFDEASAIADKIWEVAEGALTDEGTEIIWCAFGNPTQNTGRFFQAFHRFKHRWTTRQIDSRTAKMTNKTQIQKWIDDYGEDHDFVRVRVRGVFPRAGSVQYISSETVRQAMTRTVNDVDLRGWPLILFVDVARHGDDQTAIGRRKGNKVWPIERFRIADTMKIAELVALRIEDHNPERVFIDATGIGWGVVDRLRQLGYGNRVVAVQTGEAAADDRTYFNKRAECWGRMKKFLEEGAVLPDDIELETDLTGPEYSMDKYGRIQLEKKEDMKSRGLASPDSADALALSFASPVASTSRREATWRDRIKTRKHKAPTSYMAA